MPPKNKVKTTRSSSGSAPLKALTKAKATPVARARVNVRVRRGGLQDMPKMPLDVLFEIFAFLHPRDLLNLARTTKDFRALLMSRNSARFWEKARKQVKGLPDKPQHLSEPAYANLVFLTHCHNCLKTGAHVTAYWEISARYCASCRTEVFVSNCDDVFKPIWAHSNVESCDIVTRVYFKSDRLRGGWYHKAELEKVKRDWKALKTKPQKTQYIRERKKYIKQCNELSQKLERWQDKLKQLAAAENDSIKQIRYEAVLARLREEGWGEELDRMDKVTLKALSSLDGVSRATKLTDKGWATIRGSVLEYVQNVKSQRLTKERTDLLYRRLWYLKDTVYAVQHAKWSSDCKDRVYAAFADCAYIREVRAIIKDTPGSVKKQTIKAKLQDVLPSLIDRWVEDRRSELITLLRTKLGEDAAAARVPEPLQLAIASFKCLLCSADRLRWPEIVEHRCRYLKDPKGDLYDQSLNTFLQRATADRCFPGIRCIDMHSRVELTRDIISVCGADPDTVTHAEMEASVVRLACRRCATFSKQEIFDWNGAIGHDVNQHRWDSKPLAGRWMLVSEENAAKARELESAIDATPLDLEDIYTYVPRPDRYHCAWCGHASKLSEIYRHLQESHGKSQAESKLDDDFYLLKRSRPNIWMFSDVFSECESEKETVAAGKGFFASI